MPAKDLFDIVSKGAEYIHNRIESMPAFSIFIGTGQKKILQLLDLVEVEIPFESIPGMKQASVASHQNKLIIGQYAGVKIAIWMGRLHYYEGHSMDDITTPVRIAGVMGIKKAIFLNAAGGINISYNAGDLIVSTDHIYLFPENPLRGYYDHRWGPRFPDMSSIYNSNWNAIVENKASQIGIPFHRGVYVGLMGPSLETPAEYRYLRSIGADLVGMSTLPEIIVAQQMGIQKMILSVISNVVDLDGKSTSKTTVEGVVATVNQSMDAVVQLLKHCIPFFQ